MATTATVDSGPIKPSFDWRDMAPRWLLVTCIAILLFGFGVMYGKNSALDDDRLAVMAKYQNNERWNLITKLSEVQVVQKVQLDHYDSQLRQLTAAVSDLKRIAEEQRRKQR